MSAFGIAKSYHDERGEAPTPMATMDRIDCVLNNTIEHLRSVHERFDRLLGVGPEKNETVSPVPNGSLEAFEQKLSGLEHSVVRLLARIDPHFA